MCSARLQLNAFPIVLFLFQRAGLSSVLQGASSSLLSALSGGGGGKGASPGGVSGGAPAAVSIVPGLIPRPLPQQLYRQLQKPSPTKQSVASQQQQQKIQKVRLLQQLGGK